MITRKKIKKGNKIISVLGILIIIFSWFLYGCYYIYHCNIDNNDNKIIDKIIEEINDKELVSDEKMNESDEYVADGIQYKNYDYIGFLEIPKINLKKGFLNINDSGNNVNKNIQILKHSTMPDVENGILAIASHSGNGWNAFFKHLYRLEPNDKVYVYYNNIKYIYNVVDIYDEEKNGIISINTSSTSSLLVLTTCNMVDRTKQIVVVAQLIDKQKY